MIRALLACALCAGSAVASGDSIEQTFQFDCDVPPANVSDWSGTIVPRLQQVTGTIELLQPREHERWWPVASVLLSHGDQQTGLQLYQDRKTQDTLQVAVLRPGKEGRSVLTSVPWKGSPVAFRFSVTESGDVELSVAGKVALLALKDIEVEKISLSCSTAQFKFKDLVLRSQQPHAPSESTSASPQAEELPAALPQPVSL